MFIEVHDTSGQNLYINSDYVQCIIEVSGKVRIDMEDKKSIFTEENIVDVLNKIGKGNIVRTEWALSPS
jgi:hypothetical protein